MPPFLGHQSLWQNLVTLHQGDRLPHGLLLTGPEGVGKSLVAKALSQLLLCHQPSLAGEACETCQPCYLFAKQEHPDFHELAPDGQWIKMEAVRDLQGALIFAPSLSKNRVILIRESERFNASAGNALLKNLEEPLPHTYFILLTNAPGRLLPTLRSRCHLFRLGPLSSEILEEILQKEGLASVDPHLCQGSASLARQLSQGMEHLPKLENFLTQPPKLSQIKTLLKNLEDREAVETFLLGLLLQTHQILSHSLDLETEARFKLLSFAERILEIKANLRLNINTNIQLSDLMMHFEK